MNMNKSKLSILTAATLLALSVSGHSVAADEAEIFAVPEFMEQAKIKTQSNVPLFDSGTDISKPNKSGVDEISANSATQNKADQNKDASKEIASKSSVSSQTQKLDELTTKSNLGVLELTILSQELEKKKLLQKLHSDEINELINLAKSETEEKFKAIENSYISEINSLRSENQKLKSTISSSESKKSKDNTGGSESLSNPNIFVTEISGIGRNLEAKVYYNGGSTITVHEGSIFGNNIEVIKIDRAGLLLNINNKQSYLTVDDEDHAFSKMFVSDTK